MGLKGKGVKKQQQQHSFSWPLKKEICVMEILYNSIQKFVFRDYLYIIKGNPGIKDKYYKQIYSH